MVATGERTPIEDICTNVQDEFWATIGLESGVQKQTESAIKTVNEVATDLPHMEDVTLVPFGSRFKGYATLGSDLDLAIVCYDNDTAPFQIMRDLRSALDERFGLKIDEPCLQNNADTAPKISLINYGHAAFFSPPDLPFILAPAAYEGEGVAELRQIILERWLEISKPHLNNAERAFARYLINPRYSYEGVAARYNNIAKTPEMTNLGYEEIEASFQDAYTQRLHNFGGNILQKIHQQLFLSL